MFDFQKHINLDDPLLPPREAARLLGLAAHTLAVWRHRGDTRLPYVKLSRRAVRYRLSDVRGFINEHRQTAPTPEGSRPHRLSERRNVDDE
jgi:predicted DNA-binding transcriptional regulator AlpA